MRLKVGCSAVALGLLRLRSLEADHTVVGQPVEHHEHQLRQLRPVNGDRQPGLPGRRDRHQRWRWFKNQLSISGLFPGAASPGENCADRLHTPHAAAAPEDARASDIPCARRSRIGGSGDAAGTFPRRARSWRE